MTGAGPPSRRGQGQVVGRSMANNPKTELVLDAVNMAIYTRRLQPRLIHHSDRGSRGGFNWSSRHPRIWRCWYEQAEGLGFDDDRLGTDAFDGPSGRKPRCSAAVLGESRRGHPSEDAAVVACGVSPAVGARWFRQSGGTPQITPTVSGRYLSFADCDPSSPWQRGSNENTNGLPRQYFPRGTDFSRYELEELNAVAETLNFRPRKTLGWKTPAPRPSENS